MYVKVGDIDIFYAIAGAGPTCLVPSLVGTPIYERTFTPALEDVMQLVFVELRGNRTATGESDALTFDDGRRPRGGAPRARPGPRRRARALRPFEARPGLCGALSRADLPRPGDRGRAGVECGAGGVDRDVSGSGRLARAQAHPAENRARLTEDVLARLTPSERVIVPLWEGHEQLSDRLFARFWGRKDSSPRSTVKQSCGTSSRRSSSPRAFSISARRRMPGKVRWRSCRTRRTRRSSAAVTTRSSTNASRLARRWRAGWGRPDRRRKAVHLSRDATPGIIRRREQREALALRAVAMKRRLPDRQLRLGVDHLHGQAKGGGPVLHAGHYRIHIARQDDGVVPPYTVFPDREHLTVVHEPHQ